MSAKKFSRDAAQGSIKKLRRMRQPLTLPTPRNQVARAAALRQIAAGAGKHIRSQGAQRRADRMALQRLLRQTNES
ncbi:hypothetical protein SDC9_204002 [bioreactor metagenome]|uniref:Uncharacterized protein n=1 Tax=bioreactor metagenome TaxID=1076179 RepID=A0A645J770_9ZZZZ